MIHIEIPPQVEWILAQLKNHGYEAFAVGGCVRDTLLMRNPEDWDITTSATPEQVKEVFGRTIDTGLKHGTVTVLKDGEGYEITTYRIDGEYEDGRHPKTVVFTPDLKEDLRRRDFTINAMAYSHETGIVDIFGGIEDLSGKIVRCVGDAMERFTEDALRILRAVRFSAQLGFTIEENTCSALSVIAPNLGRISRERIQVEIIKILLSPHPEQILMVKETGMAPYISGGFQAVFESLEQKYGEACSGKIKAAAELERDKALRLTVFLHPVGEAAAVKVLRELKLDNDTIERVGTLVRWLLKTLATDRPGLRRVMSSMSDQAFDDLLILKAVIFPEEKSQVDEIRVLGESIRADGDCIRRSDLAVDGNDLMDIGMKPGKQLGDKLTELFGLVLDRPELNNKKNLLSAAAENGTETMG